MSPQDTPPKDLSRQEITEANRASWNEAAPIHAQARLDDLLAAAARPGFSTLDEVEREVFASLSLPGKDIAQLSCNNARELLSLKLAGAGRCTGFDIADEFIAQGRRLAAAAGAELELCCCSVYDIPASYDGAYDIVYVTVGALGWFPDLPGWFAVVNRLLRPGGTLFIYEMHPLLDMFDPETGLTLRHDYFRREAFVSSDEPDYIDPARRVSLISYWFHHTLGEIIGGSLSVGLSVERFAELPGDVSTVYRHLAKGAIRPPMSYVLVARKPRAQVR